VARGHATCALRPTPWASAPVASLCALPHPPHQCRHGTCHHTNSPLRYGKVKEGQQKDRWQPVACRLPSIAWTTPHTSWARAVGQTLPSNPVLDSTTVPPRAYRCTPAVVPSYYVLGASPRRSFGSAFTTSSLFERTPVAEDVSRAHTCRTRYHLPTLPPTRTLPEPPHTLHTRDGSVPYYNITNTTYYFWDGRAHPLTPTAAYYPPPPPRCCLYYLPPCPAGCCWDPHLRGIATVLTTTTLPHQPTGIPPATHV